MAWINPYNFVRDLGYVERDEPIWHDRFYPNTYSGRIVCKLKTLTPLFIPQPSDCVRDETEHQKLRRKTEDYDKGFFSGQEKIRTDFLW